jgi:hypothetical protein
MKNSDVINFIEKYQVGKFLVTGYALSTLSDTELSEKVEKILFKDSNSFLFSNNPIHIESFIRPSSVLGSDDIGNNYSFNLSSLSISHN